MPTFQTISFDDFPSDQPVGQEVDALAAQFDLTRNLAETDTALLRRTKVDAGYLYGVYGPVYGGTPNTGYLLAASALAPASPVLGAPVI